LLSLGCAVIVLLWMVLDSLSEQIDEAARAKEQQSFATYVAERIRASNA
jgi:hypothetical protein